MAGAAGPRDEPVRHPLLLTSLLSAIRAKSSVTLLRLRVPVRPQQADRHGLQVPDLELFPRPSDEEGVVIS